MKKFIFILLLVAGFSSCKKEEIMTFGEERYISFDIDNKENEIPFSFRDVEGGAMTAYVKVPVKYAGKPYTEAKSFSITVDEEKNMASADEFTLEDHYDFTGKSYNDTLLVKVTKSARMDKERVSLVLNLVSNDNFLAIFKDNQQATINLTNMLVQPDWWNATVVKAYLGTYSDKKYELFLEHGYKGNFGELSPSAQREYAKKFKYWLLENPTKEEDGTTMEVPVIG